MKSITTGAVSADKSVYFRRLLFRWYRQNARRFLWRETEDPYRILLSEILLQRTQAAQVQSNFKRIEHAFPTPYALAEASLRDLRSTLKPLGLAKRAVTLRQMGREVIRRYDGLVPTNVTELITLPGVGRYIAAATACFAGRARVAVVDTNVVRVFSRFFGVTSARKRPRDDGALWSLAQSVLPGRRAVDYNRAIIDFAALVCTPRQPHCTQCPLRRRCIAAPSFGVQAAER